MLVKELISQLERIIEVHPEAAEAIVEAHRDGEPLIYPSSIRYISDKRRKRPFIIILEH